MGKKHSRDSAERNAELVQTLHGAAARIKDKLFGADFDQGARSEAIHTRRRRSGPEKSYSKKVVRWCGHRLLPIEREMGQIKSRPVRDQPIIAASGKRSTKIALTA
jgi:hypothetical protein